MKQFLILITLFPLCINAQCTLNDIFPFSHNISKFEMIRKSHELPGLKESEVNRHFSGEWKKWDYLKDSVYSDRYMFDVNIHTCFSNGKSKYDLAFVDDKLYKQELTTEFEANSYSQSIEVYNLLVSVLKSAHKYNSAVKRSDSTTGEQIGEGYMFSNTEEFLIKVNDVTINFDIEFAIEFDTNYKPIRTNKVKKYIITVESTDLRETKLDNRGY